MSFEQPGPDHGIRTNVLWESHRHEIPIEFCNVPVSIVRNRRILTILLNNHQLVEITGID